MACRDAGDTVVREHLGQHAALEELPVVAEAAVVTHVTALDDNRSTETVAGSRATLDGHGTDAYRAAAPGVPPEHTQFEDFGYPR